VQSTKVDGAPKVRRGASERARRVSEVLTLLIHQHFDDFMTLLVITPLLLKRPTVSVVCSSDDRKRGRVMRKQGQGEFRHGKLVEKDA
jgi:hypothetical protein